MSSQKGTLLTGHAEVCTLFSSQFYSEGSEILVELAQAAGADDRDHAGLVMEQPGQRQLVLLDAHLGGHVAEHLQTRPTIGRVKGRPLRMAPTLSGSS